MRRSSSSVMSRRGSSLPCQSGGSALSPRASLPSATRSPTSALSAALLKDQQRTRMAVMGRIRLGESRVHRPFERGAVHTFRKRLKIDAFPFWPKRMEVGRRSCGEQICGLIAKLALALADNVRAAKLFSENGDLRADTEGRGCDKPPLAVNARLKEPHELVARTA